MKISKLGSIIIISVVIILVSSSFYFDINITKKVNMNTVHYIGAGTWTKKNWHEGKWQHEVNGEVIQYDYVCIYDKREKDYLEGQCTSIREFGGSLLTTSICIRDENNMFDCENIIMSGTEQLENISGKSSHIVDESGLFYGTAVFPDFENYYK